MLIVAITSSLFKIDVWQPLIAEERKREESDEAMIGLFFQTGFLKEHYLNF